MNPKTVYAIRVNCRHSYFVIGTDSREKALELWKLLTTGNYQVLNNLYVSVTSSIDQDFYYPHKTSFDLLEIKDLYETKEEAERSLENLLALKKKKIVKR